MDLLGGPSPYPGTRLVSTSHHPDDADVVYLDACELYRGKVHMDIEASLESGKAICNFHEPLPDKRQIAEALLHPEIGQVVGNDLVS